MLLHFLIEENHHFACEAARFFFCVLRIGVGTQSCNMVENVFSVFSAHGGNDDGARATDSKHSTRVGDIGFAAEERCRGIFVADTEVGENRKGAAGAKLVMNLDEGRFIVAVKDFDVAILTIHPGVDFWVALARGNGEEGQTVLGHRPGGHIPIARMRDHNHDAAAFIDEGLKAVLVHLTVEDIAVHPVTREVGGANHFNSRLENVRKRGARDGGTLRGRFLWKDGMDAREGACMFEAEDIEEEACEAACKAHRDAVGNGVDKCTEKAQSAIFEVDCKLAFCHGKLS